MADTKRKSKSKSPNKPKRPKHTPKRLKLNADVSEAMVDLGSPTDDLSLKDGTSRHGAIIATGKVRDDLPV